MQKKLTRRNFLKGSITAASLMGMGSLAACTAAPAASPAPGSTAPSSASAEPEAPYSFADTIAWDGEYDVLVMGFGGSGAVAAHFAAKNGASVLLFDAAPKGHEGGNTRYCGQFAAFGEDKDALLTYYKALSDGCDADEEVLKVLTENMVSLPDLLQEEYGANEIMFWKDIPATRWAIPEYPELEGSETINALSVHPGAGDGALWQMVRDKVVADSDKVDIWYESRGRKLIQDPESKTILGVVIERNGELVSIRAKNGVVMTCGGFENNPQMLANYLKIPYSKLHGSLYNRGDGISMALDINADLWHMGCIECSSALGGLGMDVEGEQRVSMPTLFQGLCGSFIVVGADGNRYMNETETSRHGHNYTCGEFKIPLHSHNSYLILDEKLMQTLVEAGRFSDEMQAVVTSANSFQELADTLNLPYLTKTISFYNKYAAAGDDPLYLRSADTLVPLTDGKCYALRMTFTVLNTQGGARRNARAEVIGTDGNPIPHLYSAGEFGGLTAKYYQGATNITECIIFGKIAGENAAAPKDPLEAYAARQPQESELRFTLGCTDEVAPAHYETGENEYIGTGTGIGGDVVVKCTIVDGKITAVEVLEQAETEGIGTKALDALPQQFIGLSSAAEAEAVDTVVSATVTSKALKAAVADCLRQAGC